MALTATAIPWRVHAVVPRTMANGPGERFAVWSQGCALACAGCFNPETHAAAGGSSWTVDELVAAALAQVPGIEGVTLTGGEPLSQPEAVAAFCAELTARADVGVIILTGYTRAEIEADPALLAAAELADLVVAGRYNERLRVATGLRGSSNKEYWNRTGRYAPDEVEGVAEMEVIIGPEGTVTVTGMAAPDRNAW